MTKLIYFSIFLSTFSYGLDKTDQPQKIYTIISDYYQSQFPRSFKADVSSKSMMKSLRSIPSYAKKGVPSVKLLFDKKMGGRFIVCHVINQYKNYFANYNVLFNILKPFLDEKDYSYFFLTYKIEPIKKFYFKLQKHTDVSTNYFIVKYDEVGAIKEINIFEKKKKVRNIQLNYTKINRYKILSLIKDNSKSFQFNNTNIDPPLSEKDFLG